MRTSYSLQPDARALEQYTLFTDFITIVAVTNHGKNRDL